MKKIIFITLMMMALLVSSAMAVECDNVFSVSPCNVTAPFSPDGGDYYNKVVYVNEWIYGDNLVTFHNSTLIITNSGVSRANFVDSNIIVNTSNNLFLTAYGSFNLTNLQNAPLRVGYESNRYDSDPSSFENVIQINLDPSVTNHYFNENTITTNGYSWWFNDSQIVPAAVNPFEYIAFGGSSLSLISTPRTLIINGSNATQGVEYDVLSEHDDYFRFQPFVYATNFTLYNPYAGVSVCDGTFTMPCVVANDWQMYTIDQDVPDLDVTLLGTGSRVNILGDLNVVGTVNPSTRCGNVILGKPQTPYVLNSDGSGIDVDVVIEDAAYSGCIPTIVVYDLENISGLNVVNPLGLNIYYQHQKHYVTDNIFPFVRISNNINGELGYTVGSPIVGDISGVSTVNSLFEAEVDASKLVYSSDDAIIIGHFILSADYPEARDYVVYKDDSLAVENTDFEIAQFAVGSDNVYFRYGVTDSGVYSLAPGEEETSSSTGSTSSSSGSSSGVSYVVDQDGNVVGRTGIVLYDDPVKTSSPTFNLLGSQGESFSFSEAWSNIWSQIKGWFVK